MRKLQLLIQCSLLFFVLLGFDIKAYAEQLDESVESFYKEQDKSGNTEQKNTTNKSTETIETEGVGLTFFDFFKMIVATIFVVALLYFIMRFINKRNQVYRSSQLVENLGGTSVGTNRSIQMIRVGNRLLVVGVADNIQLLKEIEDETEYNEIITEYNKKMDQQLQTSDFVTKVMNRKKNHPKQQTSNEPFSAVLKNQLNDLAKNRQKIMDEIEKKGPNKNE